MKKKNSKWNEFKIKYIEKKIYSNQPFISIQSKVNCCGLKLYIISSFEELKQNKEN